jgi:spore coat protein A, manganese oxidase
MGRKKATMSRRQLLKGGAFAGAGLLVPWDSMFSKTKARPVARAMGLAGTSGTTSGYAGPMPLRVADMGGQGLFYTTDLISAIPVAKPRSRHLLVDNYEIAMKQGSFKFHPSFPTASPTWGYDDGLGGYIGYLGPTIEAITGRRIRVKWVNNLPGNVDDPLGWADPNLIPPDMQMMGGRAVVHVHGGHNPAQFDGGPEYSFCPGQSRVYQYDNLQDEASIWYHDHAMGVTRLNAYAGLAGLYLIRGLQELYLNLPARSYEIPLILQDKAFTDDGGVRKLWYYKPWNPEFFGNVNLVNAQPWPVLHVEPRRYRFRIYNGTQARFYNLRITSAAPSASAGWGKSSDVPFYQIGAEGGFMPRPVKIGGGGNADALLVANGERADVIVDFAGLEGQTLYVSNDASTMYDPDMPLNANDPDVPTFTGTPFEGLAEPVLNVMQVMKIVVDKPLAGSDRSFDPASGRKVNRIFTPMSPDKGVAKYRQISLVEAPFAPGDVNGEPANRVLVNNREFTMGGGTITETPVLGSTEVWQFVNLTPDWHPMHMHLVTFQVVGRQQLVLNPDFDAVNDPEHKRYKYGLDGDGGQVSAVGDLRSNSTYTTGPVLPPYPNETGFKDTVKCPFGWVTYVVAKFTDYAGKFVYHCHILDHEENDMMQYMDVQPRLRKDSVDENPELFTLEQNYPNPFNPSTTIRFNLPEDSPVELKVFNSIGQEVTTLAEGDFAAGIHAVTFNAGTLASGTYIARIKAGSYTASKKMLLVR